MAPSVLAPLTWLALSMPGALPDESELSRRNAVSVRQEGVALVSPALVASGPDIRQQPADLEPRPPAGHVMRGKKGSGFWTSGVDTSERPYRTRLLAIGLVTLSLTALFALWLVRRHAPTRS